MPALLHDPAVRESIRGRINKLTPDTPRKWGKMTVDQMLWHCNLTLQAAMGQTQHDPFIPKVPMPRWFMRWAVLNLPWPKGAPTHPDWVAGERHDFAAQRARALGLIDEFTSRGIDDPNWGPSPAFGKMSGTEWSRLQAIHWNHHLRQFGV
jgi:hypothetical protein